MASFFIVGLLDARYKIEIKVEGGLKGCTRLHVSNVSKLYDFNYHSNLSKIF